MKTLMLNSIPASVFSVKPDQCDGSARRAGIISVGRLLAAESARRPANRLRTSALRVEKRDEVAPLLNEATYKEANEKFQADMLLYCAEVVCRQIDMEAPKTMEDFRRNQRAFMQDKNFLRVMAGLVQEIVRPVLPSVFSEAIDLTANMVEVPLGETLEIDVGSNDVFAFQDSSWGASRSVPTNYLYTKTVTLNPRPRTAKCTIKWYQLVGNGADMGQFFNAMAKGMYAETMGLWNKAMTAMAANTAIVPAALTYTYSTANFITLANKLAAVNGVGIGNLVCFGNAVACSKVLPSSITNAASTNLDAAISTLIGAEYIRAGYMGENMGVRILPMQDAIVPGTQNSTVQTVLPADTAYMMAAPGMGYKPIYIGYESGSPITVELDPSQTADMTIDVNVTMSIDVKAVAASKIGVITGL